MRAARFWLRRSLAALLFFWSLVLLASLWYNEVPGTGCRCSHDKSPTALPQADGSTDKRVSPTIVVVTCASGLELTMASLKSAVAFSRVPLRLILYADVENIKRLQDRIMEWPASALNRITYDLRLVMFPMKDFETWKKLFVPCATQRLFLPDMLPNEDAVLYVDADTLFVNPVEELWSVFEEMNESHLTALGHEIEDVGPNWYHQRSKTPFHPPFGANSGIMPMNLTRMRSFDWVSRLVPLMKEYAGRILLGDQDFINILFSAHPDKLLTFTCRWGYRQDNCKFHDSCSGETPALLHGNLKCFTAPFRSPAFSTIHRVMRKYELGTSLERNFIDPLERELRRVRQHECVDAFLLHSKQWRILARQLDNERGLNDDATNATAY
ncbi:glucoside xylosyltransferase 1-like [Ixodes scapularis]|uniref:glucoside xylosyltransferase 1-like n=1 Tax=Ixodes scapularis TaxID=6945 RepID=UPI001A9E089F|nr:glucoside xylosyltransferase 1-like [Ixodes scapularis]